MEHACCSDRKEMEQTTQEQGSAHDEGVDDESIVTFCEITGADRETAKRIIDDAFSRGLSFDAAVSYYHQTKPSQAERRIDPVLYGKALTYLEMCDGHRDQRLSDDQLNEHWSGLQKAPDASLPEQASVPPSAPGSPDD